jgi:hypothetical protein
MISAGTFPAEGLVDLEQRLFLPLGEVGIGEDRIRDRTRGRCSRIPART